MRLRSPSFLTIALGLALACAWVASCAPSPPPAACEAAVAAYPELSAASLSRDNPRWDVVAAAAKVSDPHPVCVKARAFAEDVNAARAEKAAAAASVFKACEDGCLREYGRCLIQDCGCGPPGRGSLSHGAIASCLDRGPMKTPRNEACEHACGATSVQCKEGCARSPLLEKASPSTEAAALAPAPTPPAPTGEPVDLRGPLPRPRVYVNENRWQEQGVMKVSNEIQQITSGLYTRDVRNADTLTVLTLDEDGAPLRVVDRAETEVTGEIDGERWRWSSSLNGLQIVGERGASNTWSWRRGDGVALTREQKAELAQGGGPFDDRLLFPQGPTSPGTSWAPPTGVLAALFGAAEARFTLEAASLRLVSVSGSTATVEGRVRYRATDAKGLEETRDGSLRIVRNLDAGETSEVESTGRFTQDVVFDDGTRGVAEGDYRFSDKLVSQREVTADDEPPPEKPKKTRTKSNRRR